MKFLLEIKHWQLLCMMLVPSILIESFDAEIMSIWSLIGSVWLFLAYFTWLSSVSIIIPNGKRSAVMVRLSYLYVVFYSIFTVFVYDTQVVDFHYWQIPIHLMNFAAVFYMIFSAAKTFFFFRKLKGESNINSFSAFVAFWFFPIGIFYIQPRLNEYLLDRPELKGI